MYGAGIQTANGDRKRIKAGASLCERQKCCSKKIAALKRPESRNILRRSRMQPFIWQKYINLQVYGSWWVREQRDDKSQKNYTSLVCEILCASYMAAWMRLVRRGNRFPVLYLTKGLFKWQLPGSISHFEKYILYAFAFSAHIFINTKMLVRPQFYGTILYIYGVVYYKCKRKVVINIPIRLH